MNIRIITIAALLLSTIIQTFAQDIVFISPNGNDTTADGSSHHPYHSLTKAFGSPMAKKATTDTLYINVQSGKYLMDKTLVLEQPNARPIVVQGNAQNMPQFIGGMAITEWEHWKNGIYRAYIPEVELYGFSFEQFYVNGKRATLARTPNGEFYKVADRKEFIISTNEVVLPYGELNGLPKYAVQRITLQSDDLAALNGVVMSKNIDSNPKVRFYHKWDNVVKPIEHIRRDSSVIFISGRGEQPWSHIEKGSRYFFFDYLEALDSPREWYLDRQSGYLYYYPAESEDMDTAECIAPTLRYWLRFNGSAGNPIKDISFRNISFQYNSYKMPTKGNDAEQAAASVEAATEFNYVENISFQNCEMMHTGTYAIWMKRACFNNTIDHCYFGDLGAGAIKMGETILRDESEKVTSGNVVNNSIITDGGHVFPCGVGISLFHAAHNRITHNEISNLRYSGISVGWIWGYTFNPSVDNHIAYNHIHHIGWGELSDMGAVYTLGISPGTKVVHNVIHDIISYDYGGWGLYTDEGSSDIVMSHNLVYRCKSGGYHHHYGKNNRIENNIFAFGHFYQAQFTRTEEHKSFDFKRNIILQERGATLQGPWNKAKIDFADNIYWATPEGVEMRFGNNLSQKEWYAIESSALFADPMFVDAKGGDFRFKSKRTIKKTGFEVFDYTKAGVYGSNEWIEKATMPKEQIEAFNRAVAPVLGIK